MPLIDSFRDALMGATGIVGTAISDTFSGLDATALENPYDFAQQQTPIDGNYDMQSALAQLQNPYDFQTGPALPPLQMSGTPAPGVNQPFPAAIGDPVQTCASDWRSRDDASSTAKQRAY